MKLRGLFGLNKKTQTIKKDGKEIHIQSTVNSDSDSDGERTSSNPYEYDKTMFSKFYHDLENNALPEIPDPTQNEIMDYTRKRTERLTKKCLLSDDVNEAFLQENNSIPVNVDIWVDKVYSHYFDNLMPMLGLVHWCEGARKALYKYKGYTWHTINELYPTILFD